MGSNPLPLTWLQGPIIDPKTGKPSTAFREWLTKSVEVPLASIATRNYQLAPIGQIQATAVINSRTEGIATTVGNLTSTGELASTDNIAADGLGSPLTGGRRGFIALNTSNDLQTKIANSFVNTGVNVSSTPNSATTLSNNGTATAVSIAASSNQFAPGTVNYNSGSVDPGVIPAQVYVFAADPAFAGGVVIYQQSSTPQPQTATEGNVLFGSIKTVSGTGKTGGGSTGGSGGMAGGRGFINQV
jgi:hypothetical protein